MNIVCCLMINLFENKHRKSSQSDVYNPVSISVDDVTEAACYSNHLHRTQFWIGSQSKLAEAKQSFLPYWEEGSRSSYSKGNRKWMVLNNWETHINSVTVLFIVYFYLELLNPWLPGDRAAEFQVEVSPRSQWRDGKLRATVVGVNGKGVSVDSPQ